MPALKMKTNTSLICSSEGSGLGVCKKSNKISKNFCSQVRTSLHAESSQSSTQNNQDFSNNEVSFSGIEYDEDLDHDIFDGEICHCQSPLSSGLGPSDIMELLPDTCSSDFETIFSPVSESNEHNEKTEFLNYAAIGDSHADMADSKLDNDDDSGSRSSSDDQTCTISDFHISDMVVAGFPFDGTEGFNGIIDVDPFPNHECLDRDMIFDLSGRYMILPFLEENGEISNSHAGDSCELGMMNSNDAGLYLAVQQMGPCDEVNCHSFDPIDAVDESDPNIYIRNVAELSEVVPSFLSPMKETRKRKPVTLVLDLDETLVHSTLDTCIDADFTFTVSLNLKEHIVYVRRRPHLQTFLESVAEMFEIIVFTASQSAYAAKLLDILDPEGKLISRRAYRESCILSEGTYIKDLTVLGVDLAKVAIVDNSPQVFQLQVNNGIPIKSWFDDPSDSALICLLPFLETLVDADDVRPLIANRFNSKE